MKSACDVVFRVWRETAAAAAAECNLPSPPCLFLRSLCVTERRAESNFLSFWRCAYAFLHHCTVGGRLTIFALVVNVGAFHSRANSSSSAAIMTTFISLSIPQIAAERRRKNGNYESASGRRRRFVRSCTSTSVAIKYLRRTRRRTTATGPGRTGGREGKTLSRILPSRAAGRSAG